MKKKLFTTITVLFFLVSIRLNAQTIQTKSLPKDTQGNDVNAHGGGILKYRGIYYWFGEKRGKQGSQGVNVYSSKDLVHWKFEALALSPEKEESDIQWGCIMERPKVLYNQQTHKFVMWFHLELKGQGYKAARAAVAVSDKITGPYRFLGSARPNGNMSRDMTLYQDKDGKAYLIYSSRENYDMRAALLSDDYLSVTKSDSLLFSNHREAPAIFNYQNKYYLITSACTGWKANEANMYEASHVQGPWKLIGNPIVGEGAENTFGGQSTFILTLNAAKHQFLFMADSWNPADISKSEYIWLPIQFDANQPKLTWQSSWKIN